MRLDGGPLVILSACETARIVGRAVDEVIGFEAALLRAGASGVIGALWPVSDKSAALLMLHFYTGWVQLGMEPAAALCSAQSWLRNATSEELKEGVGEYAAILARHGLGWVLDDREFSASTVDPMATWAAFRFMGG